MLHWQNKKNLSNELQLDRQTTLRPRLRRADEKAILSLIEK